MQKGKAEAILQKIQERDDWSKKKKSDGHLEAIAYALVELIEILKAGTPEQPKETPEPKKG